MKNHNYNTTVKSKITSMLLVLALSLSLIVPMAGMNVYADADSASSSSDTTAASSESSASNSESPASTSITGYKTFYTKCYNKKLVIEADITPANNREVQLQRYNSTDKTWSTVLTVNMGPEPEAEETQSADAEATAADGTAESAQTADADSSQTTDAAAESSASESTGDVQAAVSNGDVQASESGADAAEAAAEEIEEIPDTHLSISIPKEERAKTYSEWRIYVPATENASEAYSDKINIITRNLEDPGVSARSACVYRIFPDGTGKMIYSKNSYKEVAQASTTKIMTAVVLLEKGLIDSKTKISSHAASTPWGSGRLAVGDVYNTKDLLYAMLLPSSNDAATAVAERVGGSEAAFVNMMNAKAEELGLKRTHFRNPHGLDADGHYTTALELAKLTAYAYTFPEIRECWATQCKTIKSLERGRYWTLWSTNAIFSYVKNFLGGKTGTESNAGCCFTGIYTYNGNTYVTVVLGSGYGFSRWSDTKKLHNYIQNYADSSY